MRWSPLAILLVSSCVASSSPPAPAGPPAPPTPPTPPGPTTPVTVADGGDGGLREQLPFQVWPELGPRAEGLLIAHDTSWGPVFGWGRFAGVRNPAEGDPSYWFFAAGRYSAQAVYFASRGEGYNFLPRWSVPVPGGGTAIFDAAMFAPSTPDRWGLDREAHLVEVDVNRGAGAPAGLHFVITGARVLDGQPGYPVATTALAQARAAWDRWWGEHEAAAAAVLVEQGRVTPGQPFGPEGETTALGLFPSWLPRERVLRVTFVRRTERSSSRTETRVVAPSCPPGAPCMPPHPTEITESRSYGVESGLVVDVGASGVVAATGYGPAPTPTQPLGLAP